MRLHLVRCTDDNEESRCNSTEVQMFILPPSIKNEVIASAAKIQRSIYRRINAKVKGPQTSNLRDQDRPAPPSRATAVDVPVLELLVIPTPPTDVEEPAARRVVTVGVVAAAPLETPPPLRRPEKHARRSDCAQQVSSQPYLQYCSTQIVRY